MNLPLNVERRWGKELRSLRNDLEIVFLNGSDDALKISQVLHFEPHTKVLVLCPYPEGDLSKLPAATAMLDKSNVKVIYGIANFTLDRVKDIVRASW